MSENEAELSQVETLSVILDVLNQAATAHGIHEATDLGGVRDEQWPEWYAQHMVANLANGGYKLVKTAAAG
ncbi:MAG TPA: hypothetical protein VGM94_10605 [Galbitalea sp.]|jgi:hypothetical protein